eukprot:g4353.t1
MANRKKASEKMGQPTGDGNDGSDDANNSAALAPEARSSKSSNLFSRLVNKAVQRVSESVDNGRRIGKGIVDNNLVTNSSNSNNPGAVRQSSSAYNFFSLVGTVTGEVAGVGVGLLKAGLGVPLDLVRDSSRASFLKDLEKYGKIELEKLALSPPAFGDKMCVRVIAIRHGHAHHNDMGGLMSPFKRDPYLTSLGREEAHITSKVLSNANITFDALVVSPFTRTLETAAILCGSQTNKTGMATVVTPLAAEHNGGKWRDDEMNKATSLVARGDHGSNKEILLERFPENLFPQYAKSIKGLPRRWWAHGQENGFESYDSYTTRALTLRKWIGETYASDGKGKVPVIALVAHGGILTKAFTQDGQNVKKFNNCEFRIFDIDKDGNFKSPESVV